MSRIYVVPINSSSYCKFLILTIFLHKRFLFTFVRADSKRKKLFREKLNRNKLKERDLTLFEGRDLIELLEEIESLAKKGDFLMGVMFSEFDIDEFSRVKDYLSTYLSLSTTLQVGKLEKRNDDLVLKIDNWPDPDYNILYLLIGEGLYGWEWKGVFLSNTELEALQ